MSLAKDTAIIITCLAVHGLLVLNAGAPVHADSTCSVKLPQREKQTQYRLGVWRGESWEFFSPNPSGPPHSVKMPRREKLCLAWEAPPYKKPDSQVVYVSTRYRDGQPLYLFRNNAGAGVPLVGSLLRRDGLPIIRGITGDWSHTYGDNGDGIHGQFRRYHSVKPDDLTTEPWKNMSTWHRTLWGSNKDTYELVGSATSSARELPYGSERLLRLKANRPKASWVRIITRAPHEQHELRVAVSYSGDLDELGPGVYLYVLKLER